jgi:hypothetical protein
MNNDVCHGCGSQRCYPDYCAKLHPELKFELPKLDNITIPKDKIDDKLTIDQLKEVKEQYCKYKCSNCGRIDDGDDLCKYCQINNFIEELYQNGLIKV